MRPIQRIPKGLLGLLQLKQLGILPGELLETVQPTYDLFQQYAQDINVDTYGLFPGLTPPTTLGATITAPTHGVQAMNVPFAAIVPAGQLWYITNMSIMATINTAADTVRFAPIVIQQNIPGIWQIGPDVADVVSARARNAIAFADIVPFWAWPGALFAILIFDSNTATSIAFQLHLRGSALQI
jgi:hypothetical protein